MLTWNWGGPMGKAMGRAANSRLLRKTTGDHGSHWAGDRRPTRALGKGNEPTGRRSIGGRNDVSALPHWRSGGRRMDLWMYYAC